MEKDFFRKNGIDLAKSILGKYLIRKYENKVIVTKIIETEAYMGVNDKGHMYMAIKRQIELSHYI